MRDLMTMLTAGGGRLVARSSYDCSTEDLDVLNDAETGHLSIAEVELDPRALTAQVMTMADRLSSAETILIDLTGPRPKVQLLPVPGEHGVIVRRIDGLRRFARSAAGFGRHDTRWLADQVAAGGYA